MQQGTQISILKKMQFNSQSLKNVRSQYFSFCCKDIFKYEFCSFLRIQFTYLTFASDINFDWIIDFQLIWLRAIHSQTI